MTTKRLLSRVTKLILLSLVAASYLISQEGARPQRRIAVLRMKNTDPTPANARMLGDFASRLNSALSKTLDVPSEGAILTALKDENLRVDDLIDLDQCFAVGKSVKADFIVVGSLSQKLTTLYTVARVYSVPEKSLKSVISTDKSMQEVGELIDVIAHRINQAVEHPAPPDTLYKAFQWAKEFRFSFGVERVDLQPPRVYLVNASPPFEVSVKAQMERGAGATMIEIYADNSLIGAIDPSMSAPYSLREKTIILGGHEFCFQTDIKELRGVAERSITSVLVAITAKWCEDD